MTTTTTPPPPQKQILTISASKHLTGRPVSTTINTAWSTPSALPYTPFFSNHPFDLDPLSPTSTLTSLQSVLESRHWDGVLIGWCVRGHVEFTELFEGVVRVCVRYVGMQGGKEGEEGMGDGEKTKIMFCTGPDNLVEAVVRNFPVDGAE